MDKIAERTNVLTETENKSFVHAVLNAVTKGYSDNTVLEDIMDLVRRKEVSKGVIQSAPDALRSIGDSIQQSMTFLAEQIDEFEIIDEPTVKRKEKQEDDTNVVEEEMNKQEEENAEKTASLAKFSSLEVSEDWSQYSYDKKSNVMSGHLVVDFKQDMMPFFQDTNKIKLSSKELDTVLGKIYSYLEMEFKNLKATLTPEIFSTQMTFSSLEKGVAEVDYKIEGAF